VDLRDSPLRRENSEWKRGAEEENKFAGDANPMEGEGIPQC